MVMIWIVVFLSCCMCCYVFCLPVFVPRLHHIYKTTKLSSHQEKLEQKYQGSCVCNHIIDLWINTHNRPPFSSKPLLVVWTWTRPLMVTHFANLTMVSVLGLLLKTFPLLQHLWVRERNSIDPLQSLHVRTALPVGRRVLKAEWNINIFPLPSTRVRT